MKKILLSISILFVLSAKITYYIEPSSISLDLENASLTFSCPEAYELVKDKSQIYENNKPIKKFYCKRVINKSKYKNAEYNKISDDIKKIK